MHMPQSIEERLAALEKDSHEPFDFSYLIKRIEALEARITKQPLEQSDCDFYYFKPGGKWKYDGIGKFPSSGEVTHHTIFQANNGMPGISGDGRHLTIVVIPRPSCKAPFAYPRMIHAEVK